MALPEPDARRSSSRTPSVWRPGGDRPRQADPITVLGRLTGRDRYLLELLADHQVLTTEQIAALAGFPTLDRAQHRLVRLFRAHLLDRFRRPGWDGTITSWRYALGPLGGALVAAMRGTTPPRPGVMRQRLLRLAAHPALEHLLGINSFFASLTAHAATEPGSNLVAWLSERQATDACSTLARPDGLGVWHHPHGRVVFCLEYDTGSEPLTQVTAKLPGYLDLALAGGPHLTPHNEQQTDNAAPIGFWLLLHLHSAQREAHLRTHLATRQALAHPPHGVVPFGIATTNADYTHLHSPAAQIWLPLGGSQRQTLAELTHHRSRSESDGTRT
ncbi:replication-relaxation family protein [Kutzneria sp. 744]|uniref:replication-relaxation family protein n=1 Tax=Kutzneria sp. (strain 744) TaxID=345341 RepID=UPI0004B13ED2|nr:replication-relaxation family protein [Kutzneria sp. 744]